MKKSLLKAITQLWLWKEPAVQWRRGVSFESDEVVLIVPAAIVYTELLESDQTAANIKRTTISSQPPQAVRNE